MDRELGRARSRVARALGLETKPREGEAPRLLPRYLRGQSSLHLPAV